MAVTPGTSGAEAVAVASSATTAAAEIDLNVNPDADLYAVVGVLWVGAVDITAATFAPLFGGQPMDELEHILWTSNNYKLIAFGLADPPDGEQTVHVDVTGIPTGGGTRKLRVVSVVYAGTDGPTEVVVSTPATTSSNSVTVTSGAAADRVVGLHAATRLQHSFSAYNLAKRARSANIPNAIDYALGDRGEDLLLGDAPGAATVTSTATQASSANWGAIGISLGAAPVSWEAGVSVPPPSIEAGLSVYRAQAPAPDRTWLLDGGWIDTRAQDTRVGPPGATVDHWVATNDGWQAYAIDGTPLGDPVIPPGPPITFAAPVAVPGVTGTDRAAMPRTLTGARMRVASAPVGSALTAQVVHYADGVGWTTIGTLSIAAGSILESTIELDQVQLTDDLLRLNVTSVGSTTAATGVVVDVFWNPGAS